MAYDGKAIETRYAGRRFRSRLEARWAVVMDTLKVPWRYEPQNFMFGRLGYVPDFYLPDQALWLEIKGEFSGAGKHEALWKAHQLAAHENRIVIIMFGDIPYPHPGENDESGIRVHPKGYEDEGACWCVCPWCARIGLVVGGDANRLDCGCGDANGHHGNIYTYAAPTLVAAYTAGHSARFEHGESGAPHPRIAPRRTGPQPEDRAFLDRFPQNARGTLANRFLAPIRNGVTDPNAVLSAVEQEAARTIQQYWRYHEDWAAETRQREQRVITMIGQWPGEAIALARYYIAYESLPRAERDRLKARGHAALASERTAVDVEQEQREFNATLIRQLEGGH